MIQNLKILLNLPSSYHKTYERAADIWCNQVVGGTFTTFIGGLSIAAIEAMPGSPNQAVFVGSLAIIGAGLAVTGSGIGSLNELGHHLHEAAMHPEISHREL